ncbi:MAG TPA: hypothetical protein VL201_00755 [Patescibacteria group bacterium]|jgi:hypothetical protein|nr:hypothetical protein [Patescibacteria group bacterium]
MKLIRYLCVFVLIESQAIYTSGRISKFVCHQKIAKKCLLLKQNKKRYMIIVGQKIGRPYGRPGGYGWSTSPLSGSPFEGNGLGGNNFFDSLAAMAPIAIAMYCFNSAPRLTMVTLTTLLLFIAGSANE